MGTARTRSVRIAKSEPPDLAIQRELSWEPPEPPDLAIRQEPPEPPDLASFLGTARTRSVRIAKSEPPDLAILLELFGNCPNALGSDCQIRTAGFSNPARAFWEPPEPPDLAIRLELSGRSFLGTARTRSVRIAKSEPPDLAILRELLGNHPSRRIYSGSSQKSPAGLPRSVRIAKSEPRAAGFSNPAGAFWEPEPPDLAIRQELSGRSFLGTARTRSVRITKSEPDLVILLELFGNCRTAGFSNPARAFWEPPEPPDLAIRRELFGSHPNRNPARAFWETTRTAGFSNPA
ncbi:hypothetical protein QUF72_01460 [Desulfobacterales bacterium HSG2]|nr:hypothetical protein [Desulfobacterales bacterium HSG2]